MRNESYGPGPAERRWTARLHYKVFGRWPAAVVAERLAYVPPVSENVKVIMREVYATAGHPVPREYL